MSSNKGSSQDRGQRALEILLQAGELSTPTLSVNAFYARPQGPNVRLAFYDVIENRSVNRCSVSMAHEIGLMLRNQLIELYPIETNPLPEKKKVDDGPRG